MKYSAQFECSPSTADFLTQRKDATRMGRHPGLLIPRDALG